LEKIVYRSMEDNLRLSVAGITCLVISCIAFVLAWIPAINELSFVLCVVSIVLGIVSIDKIKKKKSKGKGFATAGIIVSLIAFFIIVKVDEIKNKRIKESTKTEQNEKERNTLKTKKKHIPLSKGKPYKKPITKQKNTVKNYEIIDFKVKPVRHNKDYYDPYWMYSWKVTIKNNTAKKLHLFGEIQLLDREGFLLDGTLTNFEIEPFEEKTFTDQVMLYDKFLEQSEGPTFKIKDVFIIK